MRLRGTAAPPLGESVVKLPPRRIFPSGWKTTTVTRPFAFGSKPSSADCPRTAAAPPASSTATENSKGPTFLAALTERNLLFDAARFRTNCFCVPCICTDFGADRTEGQAQFWPLISNRAKLMRGVNRHESDKCEIRVEPREFLEL